MVGLLAFTIFILEKPEDKGIFERLASEDAELRLEEAVWGSEANVTLNSPADNNISTTNSVDFNCSATVTGGATLTNISLWHNGTGSWHNNQTTNFNVGTEAHGNAYTATTGSHSTIYGMRIQMNQDGILTAVGRDSSSTQPEAVLLSSDKTVLANASWSGTQATFDYYLEAGNVYYLGQRQTGVSRSTPSGGSIDDAGTIFNWTGGLEAGGDTEINYFDIINATFTQLTDYTTTFDSTISGLTEWNCEACDSDGDCGFAPANYTVHLDADAPEINITSPSALVDFASLTDTLTLNYTITDDNLDTCWFNYDQRGGYIGFNFDASNYPTDDVTDLFGNACVGTACDTNCISTTGVVGGGIDCDGGNQYVSIPEDTFDYTQRDWTINIWINPDGENSDTIIDLEQDMAIEIAITGTPEITAQINDVVYGDYDIPYIAGAWNMYTLVKDGTNFSFYMNGTYYGSNVTGELTDVNEASNRIGEDASGAGDYDGQIDLFAYYKYALSPAAITALYNSGSGLLITTDDGESSMNHTAPCTSGVANTTTLYLSDDSDLTFWAEDSVGNINSTTLDWNYKIFENSETYNTSTYETASETFSINVTANSSLTAANLVYNGTSHTATQSGNIWTTTFDIDEGITDQTFYWDFTYAGDEILSDNNTQTVEATNFSLCGGEGGNTIFLNLTFKDEADDSFINASIPTSSFTYYLGSGSVNKSYTLVNNTNNFEYDFCATPNRTLNVIPTIQYKQGTDYPQRTWSPTVQNYTNVTTNQTLYLLASGDGIYVTFQIIDQAEVAVSGASVTVTRDDLSEIVGQGTTGADGGVTFWLNPDFSHTIEVIASGFDDYSTTLTPTQTSYTIQIGTGGESFIGESYIKGISYDILPKSGELTNNTVYNFNLTLTSSYWTVTEFGFRLYNTTGTIGTTSASTNGGTISLNANTGNPGNHISMDYYWVIEGNYSNGTVLGWESFDVSDNEWSIKNAIDNLVTYMDTGMFMSDNSTQEEINFTLAIITFLTIFIFTGIMSYKYGLTSPAAISCLIFTIVLFLDYGLDLLDKVNARIPGFPSHSLTIFTGLIFVALLIREVTR